MLDKKRLKRDYRTITAWYLSLFKLKCNEQITPWWLIRLIYSICEPNRQRPVTRAGNRISRLLIFCGWFVAQNVIYTTMVQNAFHRREMTWLIIMASVATLLTMLNATGQYMGDVILHWRSWGRILRAQIGNKVFAAKRFSPKQVETTAYSQLILVRSPSLLMAANFQLANL